MNIGKKRIGGEEEKSIGKRRERKGRRIEEEYWEGRRREEKSIV
jgi:hypothetical protein